MIVSPPSNATVALKIIDEGCWYQMIESGISRKRLMSDRLEEEEVTFVERDQWDSNAEFPTRGKRTPAIIS